LENLTLALDDALFKLAEEVLAVSKIDHYQLDFPIPVGPLVARYQGLRIALVVVDIDISFQQDDFLLHLHECLEHEKDTIQSLCLLIVFRSLFLPLVSEVLHEKTIGSSAEEEILRCRREFGGRLPFPPDIFLHILVHVLEFQGLINRHELVHDDFLLLFPINPMLSLIVVLA